MRFTPTARVYGMLPCTSPEGYRYGGFDRIPRVRRVSGSVPSPNIFRRGKGGPSDSASVAPLRPALAPLHAPRRGGVHTPGQTASGRPVTATERPGNEKGPDSVPTGHPP